LGEIAIHCANEDDLINALAKYRSSTKYIACDSSKVIGLDVLLMNYSIEKLYVLNNKQDDDIREWLYGLVPVDVIQVQDIKKLMRHLCTTAVFCYYKQCIEYKSKENNAMANLCALDSLKALDYSAKFI
jgi:hypothetical protein